MSATVILRGLSSVIVSALQVAKIKKQRQGAALRGEGSLNTVRCLVSNLVLAGACLCLLVLPACGNKGGDKVDSRGADTNPAAGPERSAVVASGSKPTASATTPDKGIQSGTTKTKNDRRVSNAPKPEIGTGGSDFFLFTQARAALNADPELKAANIVIDAKAGVLTLNGTVANAAQKSKADQLMRAVGDVKKVKNQLRILN